MAEDTTHPQDDEDDGDIHIITDQHLDETELTPDEELPPADGGVD